MNYSKLNLSFLLLLLMTGIQFTVGLFILHNLVITLLSAIAAVLCLLGLIYTYKKNKP